MIRPTRFLVCIPVALVGIGLVGSPCRGQTKSPPLAAQVLQLLEQHCFDCHGKDPRRLKGKLNLFDPKHLADADRKLAVANKPEESEIVKLVEDETMPPGKRPKVPKEGRALLRAWVMAGAPSYLNADQTPTSPVSGKSIAAAVKEVFRTHCLDCHGAAATKAGIKIMDRDLLVKKEALVPGKPEDSPVFMLAAATDEPYMPPRGRSRVSTDQLDLIRRWIADGAPPFPADIQPPAEKEKEKTLKDVVGVQYVLQKILTHVRTLPRDDKPYVRYFSVNHVLTAGATDEALELERLALAKAINHLSRESELVRPQPIDAPTNSVFAVDIRKLGWHKQPYEIVRDGKPTVRSSVNLFDVILLEYPYAVCYEDSETFDSLVDEFLGPAAQIRPVVYLRSDWLVSVATQPPLYEDLLQFPFDLSKLEEELGCDAHGNLESFRAKRAGMIVSGVSRNNRVVERQPARSTAYYWKSFDFRTSRGDENMFRDPIFLHPSGGEMVFSLPNGMQGYYVADARGNRLELAPTDIVTDKFAEDKTVRNGLACMRCHDAGIKDFADTVRPAVEKLPGSPGFSKRDVLKLYPEQPVMDEYIRQDRTRFLDALEKLFGKKQVREPLIPVSQRFLEKEISLAVASAELGLADPSTLKPLLKQPQFAALGLMPLSADGVVRRDMWEDYYDLVIRRLGLGIPLVPIDGVTRREFTPHQAHLDVDLKTNRPNNVFAPGDELEVLVVNRAAKDVYIELVGTSVRGHKVVLAPAGTVVRAGTTYRWGPFKVQPRLGKEQVTVYASDADFPAGFLLRGEGITDRFVHLFYRYGRGKRATLDNDPSRLLKKTIEFETR
jgi:serine/threonine-protein kinase